MAHSFRTATQNSSSTGTAVSVSAPTGTTAGDLVKVVVHANGQTTITDNNVLISAANLTTGNDTDGGSSSTTASITPAANKLLLISISSRHGSAAPNVPTVTGAGLTWVQVGTSLWDSVGSQRRTTVLRAMGPSPSSGALTIDFAGQGQTDVLWTVDQFTNCDTSGTNGSGAIVQTVTNDTGGSAASSLSVTLAAFSSANNATFGAFGTDTNTGHAPGSGFTSIGYSQAFAGSLSVESEFKNSNDTGVDYSVTSAVMGGIAIELKSANATFTEQIDDYKPNTTNGHTMSVFSRVIQSGDPTTYNFTSGASGRWGVIAIAITDTSTPQDDVAPSTTNATNRDSAGDGTAVTASINTGVNNASHIVVAGWDTGAIGTITTPAGYTLLANANGGGEPLHASYKLIGTAGATGTTNIVNTEFGAYITFSFSVKDGVSSSVVNRLALLGVGA